MISVMRWGIRLKRREGRQTAPSPHILRQRKVAKNTSPVRNIDQRKYSTLYYYSIKYNFLNIEVGLFVGSK